MKILKRKKEVKTKQTMLLNEALKELVKLNIATTENGKYQYSNIFEQTAQDIIANPPSKLRQLKYGQEAGRKLIAQLISMTTLKPSRRDINNMLTAYVCIKIHIQNERLEVNEKLVPDLAYAVWYLNDNQPTIEEIEEWTLT